MRILTVILGILALLVAPIFNVVLDQLTLAVALLVFGFVSLLGGLLGRKAAANSLIFFCIVLIILTSGYAFYATQGFARAEDVTQYSDVWWLVGWLVGLVLTIGVAFGVLLLSSDYIFVAQGVSWGRALLYLFSWITGLLTIYREVKHGEVSEAKISPSLNIGALMGKLLGFSRVLDIGEIVFIDSQQVVVFERSGKFTRAEGPGLVFTKAWEHVHRVFPTAPGLMEASLEEALTKDGILVDVTFSILYGLMASVPEEAIDWKKPYPVSKEAVIKATYAPFDWETAIREEAKNLLREEIANMPLDKLLLNPLAPEPFPLHEVAEKVKEELSYIARDWGTQIRSVRIVGLDAPEKANQQILQKWLAEKEKGIAEDRAAAGVIAAEGKATELVIEARSKAQERLIEADSRAEAQVKEAEGARLALVERGRGEGEARAEIFSRILGSLSRGGREPSEDTVNQVILQLTGAVKKIDVGEPEQPLD